MAQDTAIVNVDEWIGEYYLTTDETRESFRAQVTALVRGWKDSPEGAISPLGRFTAARQSLVTALSKLSAPSAGNSDTEYDIARRLTREALGYGRPMDGQAWTRGDAQWSASIWSADGMAFVEVEPVDTVEDIRTARPAGEVLLDKKSQPITLGALIGELFLSDTPPNFIAATAGRWFVLAERESWPLGRFLAIDLLLTLERNDTRAGGEIQRVVAAACRENVERRPDGTTWWAQVLEDSREHAVRVSGALREAIRESIEVIANDVLARRAAKGLDNEFVDGQDLAREALRYLYRILFLLFAEASPELHILPVGATEYDEGYGLTRLRDQILDPPATPKEENGTYLYSSLALLFRKVDEGHHPEEVSGAAPGLEFNELSADLFSPQRTRHIDEVQLSNRALHRVLENLLMTREQSGKERGFISYATLGVTELGQVYEGLMSYSGFIASEDLWEVARGGDASKGSWVVGKQDSLDISRSDLVVRRDPKTGEDKPVIHPKGSFVFRQSSRDRERSASFYTPQVLSTFVVDQALAELKESGAIEKATDILDLTICEPAMGSGAFAVEAVRQLADLYLEMRQQELGEDIDPEHRIAELQKVKAYLALHQVYGVDLNATAVELAEISLWLDTMTPGLKAPWFGLHLKRGNSLVGARRATYSATQVEKKDWLVAEPMDAPVTGLAEAIENDAEDPLVSGRIHHFLLPAAGWGSGSDAKELRPYVGDAQKALKDWRKKITLKPNKTQIKRLQALSRRVERLWQISLVKMQIAEDNIRRSITVYGAEDRSPRNPVPRAEIEQELNNPNTALQRLRLAMSAWCAMWFWPLDVSTFPMLDGEHSLPDLDEWIAGLEDLLGIAYSDTQSGRRASGEGQIRAGGDMSWDEVKNAEHFDSIYSRQQGYGPTYHAHPWLAACIQIAEQQGFFHWELDFAPVFAKGGFSLQVGNPPWVRPRTDEDALWGESDPWWILSHKPTQAKKNERKEHSAQREGAVATVVNGLQETVVTSKFLNDQAQYALLAGQQPDLYRAFMQRTWRSAANNGIIALIHPESHFTEKKAAPLRRECYSRLRRHWRFKNSLLLFDISDTRSFGIHIYGIATQSPCFLNAHSIYHPMTISESLVHDGSGKLPGFKNEDDDWDLRPHRERILTVDQSTLELWASLLEEPHVSWREARMLYSVTSEAEGVLRKLAAAPRVKELGLHYSRGWDESIDKKKGYFDTGWAVPESWSDVILQGPHFGVANPFAKQPNQTMKHHQDWTPIDLEAVIDGFIPATAYQPNNQTQSYARDHPGWKEGDFFISAREVYRIGWRQMADTVGFRTLYPALIPPGATHVNGVISAGFLTTPELRSNLLAFGACLSSILTDFLVRSVGTHLWPSLIEKAPFVECEIIARLLSYRFSLLSGFNILSEKDVNDVKSGDIVVARNAFTRRTLQIEIDALVALGLGVTADELCMIYRTQFPVMRRYDQQDLFDANGRVVPKDVAKLEKKLKPGAQLSEADRTWAHPQSGVEYLFEYPFRTLDREADMRAAYAKFETMLEKGEL